MYSFFLFIPIIANNFSETSHNIRAGDANRDNPLLISHGIFFNFV